MGDACVPRSDACIQRFLKGPWEPWEVLGFLKSCFLGLFLMGKQTLQGSVYIEIWRNFYRCGVAAATWKYRKLPNLYQNPKNHLKYADPFSKKHVVFCKCIYVSFWVFEKLLNNLELRNSLPEHGDRFRNQVWLHCCKLQLWAHGEQKGIFIASQVNLAMIPHPEWA